MAQCLRKLSSKLSISLAQCFRAYGSFTYRFAWLLICGSLLLAISLGYSFTLHEEETDEKKLWVQDDAQVFRDVDVISEAFKVHSLAEEVYVVGKTGTTNLLTAEVFRELIQYELGVWQSVEYKGRKYNDVCYKASGGSNESACSTTYYPLQFFLNEDATFDETMLSDLVTQINDGKGTADFYPADSPHYIAIEGMFGGTTPSDAQTDSSDGTNNLQEAEAIHWTFYLDTDGLSVDFVDAFENEYEEFARQFNEQSEYISVHPRLRYSVRRESNKAIGEDMGLITLGVAFTLAYSLFVVGELNTFRSRVLVGVAGIVSVGLAYVEAIGLGSLVGLKGNPYVSVLPFLMIGIGVDDMYVLITTLKQAPSNSSGKEMMEFMMQHAGLSVAITSLTNFGAFGIGSVTSILVIHDFCLYAAFGMFFDYLNQLTFFAGLLAYDIRRSERPLGDCCGLCFCKPESKVCCAGKYILDSEGKTKVPLSQAFVYNIYSKFLMKRPVKILVCVICAIVLGTNIFGATQLEFDFDFEWLVIDDFDVYKSLQIKDKYFKGVGQTVDFYSLYSEFTTTEVQDQLQSLEERIDSCAGCEKSWIVSGTTKSWYTNFKQWVAQGNCEGVDGEIVTIANEFVPESEFHHCLQLFEESSEGFVYSAKLAWEDGVLIGAAIQAEMMMVAKAWEKIQILRDLREIAESGPTDTYAFNALFYVYEPYSVFVQEATLQFACALCLVFGIILLVTADFLLALFVLLIVSATLVCQLGTIHFWGENINILILANSIMAVGIAVDFSAHLAHAFKTSNSFSTQDKARDALRIIGVGIFNGGFSTLLAILPLMLAKTYPVKLFFKSWFCTVIYGLGYALILLPVMLSFTASSLPSEPTTSAERQEKDKGSEQQPEDSVMINKQRD